jgi:quercetin dioxygenase-like cupin family protein
MDSENIVVREAEQIVGTSPRQLELLEGRLLTYPQVDVPLKHQFAPGVYVREVEMPKGSFVLGHEHRTEHFNIVLSGSALVLMEGKTQEIVAPCIFKSHAGVRKLLYIRETMRWATVHATDEKDLEKLDELLVLKSETFHRHELEFISKLKLKEAA